MSTKVDHTERPKLKFSVVPESKIPPFTEHFPYYSGVMRCEQTGFNLSPEFVEHISEFTDFQPRTNDAWVVTFPKCGTTWTQEMVWMIVNNCDEETSNRIPLTYRSPFLELTRIERMSVMPKELIDVMPTVETISQMPSPRVIKSHLPFFILPPQLLDTSKVVYVARNPKDVLVSFYYHHKLLRGVSYTGDLETFAYYFMNDLVFFAPYFQHVLDAWSKRNHPNLLFLFYEDMKKDLKGEIEKVAKFLDKPLTEDQIMKLREHLRIDNFAKNDSVNFEIGKKVGFLNQEGQFVRKGKTGDWKNHISPELNQKLDKWIEEKLAGSDLQFVTELEHQD